MGRLEDPAAQSLSGARDGDMSGLFLSSLAAIWVALAMLAVVTVLIAFAVDVLTTVTP